MKKRKKMSREERAAWEAHLDERVRQLREREARIKVELAERAKSHQPSAASPEAT